MPLALHTLFPAANISKEGWLDVFDPLFNRIQVGRSWGAWAFMSSLEHPSSLSLSGQDAYMARLLATYGNTTHW